MHEPGIDQTKIKRWSRRIKPSDLVWLRETVDFALATPCELISFIESSLSRARDPQVNHKAITQLITNLTSDEIIWFCDHYKQPPQHEERVASSRTRSGFTTDYDWQ